MIIIIGDLISDTATTSVPNIILSRDILTSVTFRRFIRYKNNTSLHASTPAPSIDFRVYTNPLELGTV